MPERPGTARNGPERVGVNIISILDTPRPAHVRRGRCVCVCVCACVCVCVCGWVCTDRVLQPADGGGAVRRGLCVRVWVCVCVCVCVCVQIEYYNRLTAEARCDAVFVLDTTLSCGSTARAGEDI